VLALGELLGFDQQFGRQGNGHGVAGCIPVNVEQ
jgi:hypothetical protein